MSVTVIFKNMYSKNWNDYKKHSKHREPSATIKKFQKLDSWTSSRIFFLVVKMVAIYSYQKLAPFACFGAEIKRPPQPLIFKLFSSTSTLYGRGDYNDLSTF